MAARADVTDQGCRARWSDLEEDDDDDFVLRSSASSQETQQKQQQQQLQKQRWADLDSDSDGEEDVALSAMRSLLRVGWLPPIAEERGYEARGAYVDEGDKDDVCSQTSEASASTGVPEDGSEDEDVQGMARTVASAARASKMAATAAAAAAEVEEVGSRSVTSKGQRTDLGRPRRVEKAAGLSSAMPSAVLC